MSPGDRNAAQKTVLVCQHHTCRKQGAGQVLAAFQAQASAGIVVTGVSCMGQCGNGPMVRVLPEDIWYWRVCAVEVAAIVERHLVGGHPITAMLYPYAPDRF
ncbi:MAG: (2Fe-2S) ferredoxin domain-containing protein [Leptolyngbyaceae cyanobacterium]